MGETCKLALLFEFTASDRASVLEGHAAALGTPVPARYASHKPSSRPLPTAASEAAHAPKGTAVRRGEKGRGGEGRGGRAKRSEQALGMQQAQQNCSWSQATRWAPSMQRLCTAAPRDGCAADRSPADRLALIGSFLCQ